MKPVIKSMWLDNPDLSLEDYIPVDSEFFGFWLELRIGTDSRAGGDDFRIFVCTPQWLLHEYSWQRAVSGKHMLFLFKYDLIVLKNAITEIIETCAGDNWDQISGKISKFAAWEFEDYKC